MLKLIVQWQTKTHNYPHHIYKTTVLFTTCNYIKHTADSG